MKLDIRKKEACIGCKLCEMACSLFHDHFLSPHRSSIRVERTGITEKITICRQCEDAPCAEVCPEEAIYQRDDGVWIVDVEACVGCGECVESCPYDAIHVIEGIAVKCDMCDGKAMCAVRCPRDVLEVEK